MGSKGKHGRGGSASTGSWNDSRSAAGQNRKAGYTAVNREGAAPQQEGWTAGSVHFIAGISQTFAGGVKVFHIGGTSNGSTTAGSAGRVGELQSLKEGEGGRRGGIRQRHSRRRGRPPGRAEGQPRSKSEKKETPEQGTSSKWMAEMRLSLAHRSSGVNARREGAVAQSREPRRAPGRRKTSDATGPRGKMRSREARRPRVKFGVRHAPPCGAGLQRTWGQREEVELRGARCLVCLINIARDFVRSG